MSQLKNSHYGSYLDYIDNKHKYKFYIIEVDNKYLKLYDYDIIKFELSNEFTRIRLLDDAKYISKIAKLKYDSSNVDIKTIYE